MDEVQPANDITSEFGWLPDHLQLGGIVGRGGSGLVLRARDLNTAREVAIKILFKSAIDPASASIERFAREAKILANLDHAHIVKIYTSGVSSKGNHFHVMEWLDGISLAEQLESSPILPDALFYELFIQILSALQYAHSTNVVHRDIKPSNIMLCQETDLPCLAKLVDFGIARQVSDQAAPTDITKTGLLVGTPLYMSPEQCSGAKQEAKSDIYSLACVMYQCLTAQPPFPGEGAMEIMYKHLHEEAPPLALSRGGAQLSQLLKRCLAKDPERRPDAGEMLENLKLIQAEFSGPIQRIEKAKPSANKPKIAVAVLSCVVLILAMLLFEFEVQLKSKKEIGSEATAEKERFAQTKLEQQAKALEDLNGRIERADKRLAGAKGADERIDCSGKLARLLFDRGEIYERMEDQDQSMENTADADFQRILQLAPIFDKEEKSVMRSRSLSKIAGLKENRLQLQSALDYFNQSLASAIKSENSMVETDVLASRARLFLRLKRLKESQTDLAAAVRIWSLVSAAGNEYHAALEDRDLAVNIKALQAAHAINEDCKYRYNTAQRIQALKNLLLLSQFLLDHNSAKVSQSAGFMIAVLKTIPESASEAPALAGQVYELAAQCAQAQKDSAKALEYRKLSAKYK